MSGEPDSSEQPLMPTGKKPKLFFLQRFECVLLGDIVELFGEQRSEKLAYPAGYLGSNMNLA